MSRINIINKTTVAHELKYITTSEPDLAAKENQLFDNVDNTRSVHPKNKTTTDNYVAKLSSKNSKTILGPDITLKVMAGDTVKISAEALYIKEKSNPKKVAKNVINNFITAFTTLPSMAAEGVNALVNSSNQGLANAILNMQQANAANGAPKAFLNYLLYDEYMNLIPEGSGALQVKNKEDWQTLQTDKIPIPQNGFIRVFSSNMETAPISINNTTLVWTEGQLVEEYNYYPYGLVFNQSSASGVIKKTDYLYNGKELQHNEFGAGNGLELEDYGARMCDPQVGRWTQVDPLAEMRNWLSPYNYCQNNPVFRIDPTGALDGDYTKSNGTIIGNDGKNDENIHLVTNKKDIKTIKQNNKEGKSTDASNVNIDLTTTKTELTESVDVLKRTIDNGGFSEETSVITPKGEISRGKSGAQSDGKSASAALPFVAGNDNTSIHSHPTGETATLGFDAFQPGPKDAAAFKGFNRNIIVGPLGAPSTDAYGNSVSRTNGAVFYNRNAFPLGSLSERAIKKILTTK